MTLPIESVLAELLCALGTHNRCILVAQPGAGKTTRVPLALLEATAQDAGRWLLLEPRRVAARLAAGFMAAQCNESPGETVGYRVRGETRVGRHTRLEIVTQGILTRMLQDDPGLDGVAGIIFDEFHERSLEADFGLALSLEVQRELRSDLKLLVMSATLDTAALLQVMGEDTPVIDCPGRVWPVATLHRPLPARDARRQSERERTTHHQTSVICEALADNEGDILVFLPGQGEIRRLQQALQLRLPADIDILPLHGQLPLAEQQKVITPTAGDGRRRIILATSIAESSLTVPGVRIVIDAGLERVPVFNARSGLNALQTRQVNRASADQRRGRAGREAAGFCYRLWSAESMLAPHREPEILQADLSGLVFELLRWGMRQPLSQAAQLPWIDSPPPAALASGQQLLEALGIMDRESGGLTGLGRRCSRWPTHPRLAAMLDTASRHDCLPLACWLVAWVEEAVGGPEVNILRIMEAGPLEAGPLELGRHRDALARWQRAARQWATRLHCDLQVPSLQPLSLLLITAWPDRLAIRQGVTHPGQPAASVRYRLATGGQALLPENHPLSRAALLVAVQLDGNATGARIFHAAAIDASTIKEALPQARQWRQEIRWDSQAGRLIGEEVRGVGAVVLASRPLQKLPAEAVRAALVQALRQRGELRWSEDDQQLLGRLRLLRRILGAPWPEVSDTALLAGLEQWLAPRLEGITRLDELDRLPLAHYYLESLDWALTSQLPSLAPTHMEVPSGSRIAIDYSGDEPVLAVKLQEMFGLTATPAIVDGRVPLLLHLLSPARRPVQVTRDLAGFWAGSYFEVRKDLRGRYPRHPWPDDPLQAIPTRRTKTSR